MKRDELITRKGKITEASSNFIYKVELEDGHEVLCYVSGKMRKYHIRILVGDTVTVELSPYDPFNGRIMYRH